MAELFLSYAHQDIKRAETLAQLLEAAGLTVWWDRRMVAGDKINDVIDEELEKAKAIIVLWSRISVKSDWVRGEASTAQELGKLIPIKIEECKLPIQYRGIHTPEVYKKAELQELAQILTEKFKAPQPSTQGTAPGPSTAPKIEFTDKSASNFIAKLAAERAAYKSELAENKPAIRAIRKHPVGAALGIGLGVLYLLAYIFLNVVTSPVWMPEWVINWEGALVLVGVCFIFIFFIGEFVYNLFFKGQRRGS
jgi:TIR domain